ncbi:MAG TPA: nucleotidyltransferase domain-containing protein [Thiobacillus sp.]|nr:nucleotidyltransferase domain-containing protein [Thiobacillus sp.]
MDKLPDINTVMACGAFLKWVAPRFPVAGAILYGSRARGTHRPDSDADLAVILERTDRRRLDIVKAMADLAFDVLLDTGIKVTPLPVWIDEWEHPETHPNPDLIENIHREGLAVARPSIALRKHLAAIHDIVTFRRCENPRVFGSVLRGEDHIGSDLDLLVDPTKGTTLFDLGGLQHDLIQLLKVRVQVVTPGDLPEKWRQQVLDEAKPLDWFKE